MIVQWFGRVQESLNQLVDSVKRRFHEGLAGPLFQDKERPMAIRICLSHLECFIVLNHRNVSEVALDRLPEATVRMFQFIAESGLPEETTVLQLCLDPATGDWRYLLVPSHRAFGHFVDRIIDLTTGKLIYIRSSEQLIKLLGVDEREGVKFLIDPYRYME